MLSTKVKHLAQCSDIIKKNSGGANRMKLDTLLKSSPILQQPASTHESVKVKQPEHPDMQQTIKEESVSKEESFSKEEAAELVKGLNDFIEPMHTSIKFELHDKLDRYYVSVIDKNTYEVIKEIPPKKMLDMYAAMAEFMGFIVDEKV